MNTYLIKLSQNILQIILIVTFLFSLSLAYLLSKGVLFFTNTAHLVNEQGAIANNFQTKKVVETEVLDKIQVEALATDNLFRGSPVVVNNTPKEQFDLQGLTLVGVLAGSPRIARATILEEGKKADIYGLGDTLKGGKIVAINRNSVTFEGEDKKRATLVLGEKAGPSLNTSITPKAGSTGSKVQNITLNRDRFKQLIKNQAELFRLKFAPNIEGTKITGWKLLKVPEDHFLYSMGARSGDIIKKYNNQELESQDRMISMWLSLQTANKVSVDLDRGGEIYTYNISIQ